MSGVSTATVLAAASIAATVASTAMSFMSQQQQMAAMGAQANYQRQIAEQRQQVALQMAHDARLRGEEAEQRQRTKTQSLIGTQIAALAGQGTDLMGSPSLIIGDTAAAGEVDALTIRSNARREAYSHEIQATNFANEAVLATSRGSGSMLGSGASLLSGTASIGERWWRMRDAFSSAPDGGRASATITNGLI